jgi:death-on-curing protein
VTAWRWVAPEVVYAIHDRQLSQHGGGEGLRDLGMIESALARPQNLAAYGDPDAAALAAAYAFGIARNHGFVDGNKRTAWVVARLFLADNGCRLQFDKADAVRTVEQLAAAQLSEDALADWFRGRLSW